MIERLPRLARRSGCSTRASRRHQAFLDATHAGVPLRNLDEYAPPAVAWLFDTLAGEITQRLKLDPVPKKAQALLV